MDRTKDPHPLSILYDPETRVYEIGGVKMTAEFMDAWLQPDGKWFKCERNGTKVIVHNVGPEIQAAFERAIQIHNAHRKIQ